MRQDLFIIPHQWLGLPVFGFGWLLILWVIGSIVLLGWLWRREGRSEAVAYVPVLLAVAVVIAFVLPRLEQRTPLGEPIGLPIRGFGVMMLLAVVAGVGLAARQAARMGLNPDIIYSLAFWVFVMGTLGARTFYVIQYWERFQQDTWVATLEGVLNVTAGGLVVYGAVIAGLGAGLIFLTLRRLPVLAIADLVTPSLLLGLAIGRIGCLLNGCCYGGLCDQPWWCVRFPAGSPVYEHQMSRGQLHGFELVQDAATGQPAVRAVHPDGPAETAGLQPGALIQAIDGYGVEDLAAAGYRLATAGSTVTLQTDRGFVSVTTTALPPRSRPVHPTQVYSAINAALLCLLLWAYYPFRRRDGQVFAAVLVLYPVTRFLLELVRTDEPGRFGTGLSISQIVSLGLIAIAAAVWAHVLRQPPGSALPIAYDSYDSSQR